MKYLSGSEAAALMGITVRRVQQMCKNGEIPGAIKNGRAWMIPINAVKGDNLDNDMLSEKKKALPIGISDFKLAVTEYYYVDKTL